MNPDKLVDMLESALAGNTISLVGKTKEKRLALLRGEEEDPRLQQFREEFERQRDIWLASADVEQTARATGPFIITTSARPRREVLPQIVGNDVEQWANAHPYFDCDEVREAARRYIIARDFNVWEDGKWQMLWKLQRQ